MSTESTMVLSNKTARQIFDEIRNKPSRKKFGFGNRMAIVNVDPQKSYTRPDLFKTAYVTDPEQMNHINNISKAAREKGLPVIWTHVAYMDNAADCGVWGTISFGEIPEILQISLVPLTTAREGSSGVDGTFVLNDFPVVSSNNNKSVKVPPTSTPSR